MHNWIKDHGIQTYKPKKKKLNIVQENPKQVNIHNFKETEISSSGFHGFSPLTYRCILSQHSKNRNTMWIQSLVDETTAKMNTKLQLPNKTYQNQIPAYAFEPETLTRPHFPRSSWNHRCILLLLIFSAVFSLV